MRRLAHGSNHIVVEEEFDELHEILDAMMKLNAQPLIDYSPKGEVVIYTELHVKDGKFILGPPDKVKAK
jgi:hypothetical protein